MVSRRRNQVHDSFINAFDMWAFSFLSHKVQQTSRHKVSPIIYLPVYLVVSGITSKFRNPLSLFIEVSVLDSLLYDCKREAPIPLDEFWQKRTPYSEFSMAAVCDRYYWNFDAFFAALAVSGSAYLCHAHHTSRHSRHQMCLWT